MRIQEYTNTAQVYRPQEKVGREGGGEEREEEREREREYQRGYRLTIILSMEILVFHWLIDTASTTIATKSTSTQHRVEKVEIEKLRRHM